MHAQGFRNILLVASLAAAACVAASGAADARSRFRCTSKQMVAGTVQCSDSNSNSADFTNPCSATPSRLVEVEVECPYQPSDRDSTSGDYYDGVDSHAGQ